MEQSFENLSLENVKEPMNLVFIGHVDAGKSTLGGCILVKTGNVDARTLEKYQTESKEMGRESWYLSWALDLNEEERNKGITVEVGRAVFETEKRRYTILDAPGHKNYVPNMISGAAQADVAILVISARRGEFETGFERGGQTREHALLARTLGVQRLVVVINKMDESSWSKERYDECVNKLLPYLKQVGFNPAKDLDILPLSGFKGLNITERLEKGVADWYSGPAMLELLDSIPCPERQTNLPFLMPIVDKGRDMGTLAFGKVERGTVKRGQSLIVMPIKRTVDVTGIYFDETEVSTASSGDILRLKLRGVEEEELAAGFVLCDPERPIHVVTIFEAQLMIIDTKSIICPGYSAMLHVHTLTEEVVLSKLCYQLDPKTKEKIKKKPTHVKQGQAVIAILEARQPICVETYETHKQLGRFSLRDEGKTVAMGIITRLKTE